MYFFYALLLLLTYSRYFFGENVLNYTTSSPESCADLIQTAHGKKDRPCERYSLTIQKIEDMVHEGKRIPVYHLRANGFPRKRDFQIAHRNALGKKIIVLQGKHLNDGWIKNQAGSLSKFEIIAVGGFQRGEPSQFLLIDPQDQTTNATFYLPYPAEPIMLNNLKVSLHYISPNPKMYLFDLENLKPEEIITVSVKNGSDKKESTCIGSKSGRATSLVAWGSKEEPKGEYHLRIQGKEGIVEGVFPWCIEANNLPAPLVIFTVGCSLSKEDLADAKNQYSQVSFPQEQPLL